MSKSTPGPWHADGQAGGTLAFAKKHDTSLMVRGRSCTVAEVIPHGNATEANARLIAAAPDLLAALLALQSVSFHQSNCPAFPPGCVMEACECGFDEAEELARAAIAKARGGK